MIGNTSTLKWRMLSNASKLSSANKNTSRKCICNVGAKNNLPLLKGQFASAYIAAATLLLLSSEPAYAEERNWRPRRHHRHIKEQYSNRWAQIMIEAEEMEKAELAKNLRKLEAIRREKEMAAIKERQQAEESIRRRQAQMQAAKEPNPLDAFITIGGVEISAPVAALAAAGLVAAVVVKSGLLNRGSGKRGGGRWVYDRSLGGKKVWVPDAAEDLPTSSVPKTPEEVYSGRVTSTDAAVASATSTSTKRSRTFTRPSWWDAPPAVPVSEQVRASMSRSANSMLRRLEGSKNQGRDYSPKDLVTLRSMCQEGQVTVEAKTVGGRDALLAAGIELAINAAADPNSTEFELLGDIPPLRLACGLCADLEVPEERGVMMIRNAVAAYCRARLLETLTALKKVQFVEASYQMRKMISLLESMPILEPQSKEAQLIGESLTGSITTVEQQAVLDLVDSLGWIEASRLALLRVMLGV